MKQQRKTVCVLGSQIDACSWAQTIEKIGAWADERERRAVCICNVHSVVLAKQDASYQGVLNAADMATPDGAPIALLVGKMGGEEQPRINGPDLMWKYFEHAQVRGHGMYFYGGTPQVLERLVTRLRQTFPRLVISGWHSPPFRTLSSEENEAEIERINASGASVVWVGLGCPKQERWMLENRERVNAVTVGVGAAFDYHAGVLRRAPVWMQNSGLEWFFRLLMEPRRLWRRYLITNSLFLFYAFAKLFLPRRPVGNQ